MDAMLYSKVLATHQGGFVQGSQFVASHRKQGPPLNAFQAAQGGYYIQQRAPPLLSRLVCIQLISLTAQYLSHCQPQQGSSHHHQGD